MAVGAGDLFAGERLIRACAAARDEFAKLTEAIRAADELCQGALAAADARDAFAGRRLIEATTAARDLLDAMQNVTRAEPKEARSA